MMKKTLLTLAIASTFGFCGVAAAADMASPPNSLVVTDSGDVGVGSDAPEFDLHVFGDGGGSVEQVLRLESAVPPQMTFKNSVSGALWYFAMTGTDDFKVSLDGTGNIEAKFFQNGDLQVLGTLIQGSDRNHKQDIEPVDSIRVLETVAKLPISTWEYKGQDGVTHLGPMAQDFHAAFGLGNTPTGIATIDAGGVALAAIKGLNQVVQQKDAEISALKQRLTRLEAQQERLTQLEELLRDLTVKGEVAQR